MAVHHSCKQIQKNRMKEVFFPKVKFKGTTTAVQHRAQPSAPLLLLLPPMWHQGGWATFLAVKPAQPTHHCLHPLLWTPKTEGPSPGTRSSLSPDLPGSPEEHSLWEVLRCWWVSAAWCWAPEGNSCSQMQIGSSICSPECNCTKICSSQ